MAVDCHISPRWLKGFLTNGCYSHTPPKKNKGLIPNMICGGKVVKNLGPKLARLGFWVKMLFMPGPSWSLRRPWASMMVQPRKTVLEPSARASRADRVLRFTLPETITRLKLKPPEKFMVGRRSGFLPGRFGPMFRGYLYFWGSAYVLNFRSEEWGHWWIHHNNRRNIRISPWKLNPGSLSLKSDKFVSPKGKGWSSNQHVSGAMSIFNFVKKHTHTLTNHLHPWQSRWC